MTPSQSLSPEHQRLLENASWLQRLATSLVRDPQLADDMVQQTMIAALEGATDQVSKQRPWLARVLRNKVNANYRSTSRRQIREQKVAVEECGELPHEVIERAEIGKLLTEAVLRLEEPFRTTLLMRYHEDKTPKEIARELGIPAATVRTRVSRGLAKLRREISHELGEDWKACSPALLAFAGVGGAGAVKSGFLFTAGLLLLCLSVVVFTVQPWNQDALPPSQDVALPSTGENESLNQALLDLNEPALDSNWDIQREPMQATSPAPGKDSSSVITLRGRCVAKESGQPLSECRIEIWGDYRMQHLNKSNESTSWDNPSPIITDETGRFEFELTIPNRNLQLTLLIKREGRLQRRGVWNQLASPIASSDFGDVALEWGTILTGRILNERGQPIVRASVSFDSLFDQSLTSLSEEVYLGTGSNDNGEFRLGSALPPGLRNFKIQAKGYLLTGPDYFVVKEGQSTHHLDLIVKAMPYIEGVLHYANGTPVHKAIVQALTGPGWTATDRTDESGKFRVYATSGYTDGFRLLVSDGGIQRFTTKEEYHWGDRNLNLTAIATTSASVLAVEDSTGEPVEDYTVVTTLEIDDGMYSTANTKQFPGSHPDGLARLEGLHSGRHSVKVFPDDSQLRAVFGLKLTTPLETDEPLRVRFLRMEPIQIQVLSADGTPISGSTVRVAESYESLLPNPPVDPRDGRNRWLGMPRAKYLSEGITDENGMVGLFILPSLDAAGIQVTGEHTDHVVALASASKRKSPVEIVLGKPSSIQGLLLAPEPMASGAAIFFQEVDPTHMFFGVPEDQLVFPNENGNYERTLPPGEYEVFFMIPQPATSGFSMGAGWVKLSPALGKFSLKPGEALEANWDGRHFAPGSLSGRITLDGIPQPNVRFWLKSNGFSKDNVRTDENGAFSFDDLPPAEYRVWFRGGDGNQQWPWGLTSTEVALIISEGEFHMDFNFTYRTLRVRPLHPETGLPFAHTTWNVSAGSMRSLTSDEKGWLTITPAPYSKLKIGFRDGEIGYLCGPFQVDQEKAVTELEIQTTYSPSTLRR